MKSNFFHINVTIPQTLSIIIAQWILNRGENYPGLTREIKMIN